MYKVKCKIKVSNINQSYNTDLILEKINMINHTPFTFYFVHHTIILLN